MNGNDKKSAALSSHKSSLSATTHGETEAEWCRLCGGTKGHWEGCKAPDVSGEKEAGGRNALNLQMTRERICRALAYKASNYYDRLFLRTGCTAADNIAELAGIFETTFLEKLQDAREASAALPHGTPREPAKSSPATPSATNTHAGQGADTERLNWIASHPHIHFDFHPFLETWHEERKQRFPAGYWSVRFGRKDFTNAFTTLREAVDDSIERNLSEHVTKSDSETGASDPKCSSPTTHAEGEQKAGED